MKNKIHRKFGDSIGWYVDRYVDAKSVINIDVEAYIYWWCCI